MVNETYQIGRTMLQEKIRNLERVQSWAQDHGKLELSLQAKWSADEWLCLLSCYDFLGKYQEMQEQLRNTEEAKYAVSPEAYALRMYMQGRVSQALGEYGRALSAYAQAAAVNPSESMRSLLSVQTGTIQFFTGDKTGAILSLTGSAKTALDNHDYFLAAHAMDFLSTCAIERNDLHLAKEHLDATCEYARKSKNRHRLYWGSFTKGQFLVAKGDRSAGFEAIDEAIIGFRKAGADISSVFPSVKLAEELIRSGDFDTAGKLLTECHGLARPLKFNMIRHRILKGLAAICPPGESNRRVVAADSIYHRAKRAMALENADGHVFTLDHVHKFIRSLNPDLFEILVLKILTAHGMECGRTPLHYPDFDIVANQTITYGTGTKEPVIWGVSCKRYFARNVSHHDLPNPGLAKHLGYRGIMVFTSAKFTEPTLKSMNGMTTLQFMVEGWDGDRISDYLLDHDSLMSELMG